MTQRAVVRRRLDGNRVEIAVRREPACGHSCGDCAGCAAMVRTPMVTAVAADALGVSVGQTVTVESRSKAVLWYAAVLYLLPFLGLFLAAVALQGCGDSIAALGSVGVFAAVLVGVSVPLDRWLRRHKTVTYRVVAAGE